MWAALLGLMLECSTKILPEGESSSLAVGRSPIHSSDLRPIHSRIDVSRAGQFKLLEAFNRTDAGDNFLGDLARRFAKFFRQFESQRERVLTELNFRRLLDDDFRQL